MSLSKSVATVGDLHILTLLCLLVYLFTAGGHFISTDEEDLFQNTQLLARQISGLIAPAPAGSTIEQPLVKAPQEIGQSALALPVYWTSQFFIDFAPNHLRAYLQRAAMTAFNIVVTTATALVLFSWVSQLPDGTRQTAWACALLFAFATLAWPYSKTFYREPLLGLCILGSFWQASVFRTKPRRSTLLVSIGLLMVALATKLVAILVVPFWLYYVLKGVPLEQRVARQMSTIVLGSAFFVFVWYWGVGAKQEMLGNYLQEVQFDAGTGFSMFVQYGLFGLLLSSGKGLLICVPILVFSIVGYSQFMRNQRDEAIVIAGIFVLFLVIYSTRRGWHGGVSWGPRYLVPIVPLLMLPISSFVNKLQPVKIAKPAVWISGLLAGLSIMVQFAAVSINPISYYMVRDQEGVISPESFDGGPRYLYELNFNPRYSPVIGHGELLLSQLSEQLSEPSYSALPEPMPSDPNQLVLYLASARTLDFWWIYLNLEPNSPALGGKS